jgi:hypothetical protein
MAQISNRSFFLGVFSSKPDYKAALKEHEEQEKRFDEKTDWFTSEPEKMDKHIERPKKENTFLRIMLNAAFKNNPKEGIKEEIDKDSFINTIKECYKSNID